MLTKAFIVIFILQAAVEVGFYSKIFLPNVNYHFTFTSHALWVTCWLKNLVAPQKIQTEDRQPMGAEQFEFRGGEAQMLKNW